MEVIGLLMIATTLQSRHQKLLTQKIGIKLISTMLLPTQLMLFHKNIQVVIIMELELILAIINQILQTSQKLLGIELMKTMPQQMLPMPLCKFKLILKTALTIKTMPWTALSLQNCKLGKPKKEDQMPLSLPIQL
jgi:hypothetical protein